MTRSLIALIRMAQATTRSKQAWSVLALACIVMTGCGPGDVASKSMIDLPPDTFRRTAGRLVDSLPSEPFGPSDLIARALQMTAAENYLFVTDFKAPYVHVLDPVTGDHIRSFGLQGEGPGDFLSTPSLVAASARGDTVWFYQMAAGRLSGVAVGEIRVDSLHPVSATRTLDPGTGYTVSIDGPDRSGNFLGMTDTRHGLQAYTYSLPSARLTTRDTLALNDDRMDPSYLGTAYIGALCYVPRRNDWVHFSGYAGWAAILDSVGAIRGELPTPFRWRPHVEESAREPGRIVFGSNKSRTRHACLACAATDRFVYALYLGHLTGDGGGRDYFDRLPPAEVHVFDMSYKLVKTFVLDHVTSVLTVLPGDSVLFSVGEDPTGGPRVRRTRLPQ